MTVLPNPPQRDVDYVRVGLIMLSEAEAEQIAESQHGFGKFSVARTHEAVKEFARHRLCLVYAPHPHLKHDAYLALVKSKQAVTTTDSRLVMIHGSQISNCTPGVLSKRMDKRVLREAFLDLCSSGGTARVLSKRTGEHVYDGIAARNGETLKAMLRPIERFSGPRDGTTFEATAIMDALTMCGIDTATSPDRTEIADGASSGLDYLSGSVHLLEDQVIADDARDIPGWDLVSSHVTGKAVFTQGGTRLQVFTANRTPVEKATGADLVYINPDLGNAVMVQYKMLEQEEEQADGGVTVQKHVFRPDSQFKGEVARMKKLTLQGLAAGEYRLNDSPFFFRFVRRITEDLANKGFTVSLAHLDILLASPSTLGTRGARVVSYDVLDKRYLRKADFIGLLGSGYIGCSSQDTDAIAALIDISLSQDHRSTVIAMKDSVSSGRGEE